MHRYVDAKYLIHAVTIENFKAILHTNAAVWITRNVLFILPLDDLQGLVAVVPRGEVLHPGQIGLNVAKLKIVFVMQLTF